MKLSPWFLVGALLMTLIITIISSYKNTDFKREPKSTIIDLPTNKKFVSYVFRYSNTGSNFQYVMREMEPTDKAQNFTVIDMETKDVIIFRESRLSNKNIVE